MMFTQPIEEIIKTVIYTGSVKNEKPVNLMLVAKPEHGKSELILKYVLKNNPPIYILTDFSVTALRNMMSKLKEGKITHIANPDFIKIISRKQSSVDNTVTMLNSLIEEGIIRIELYGYHFESNIPVRCGLISAITPQTMNKKKVKATWKAIGLDTRMLFISWSYTQEQKNAIRKAIRKQENITLKPEKLRLPKKPIEIKLTEKHADMLTPLIDNHIKIKNTTGFRYQKQLQTMSKARAIINGKKAVTKKEIEEITALSRWLNTKQNPLPEIKKQKVIS